MSDDEQRDMNNSNNEDGFNQIDQPNNDNTNQIIENDDEQEVVGDDGLIAPNDENDEDGNEDDNEDEKIGKERYLGKQDWLEKAAAARGL